MPSLPSHPRGALHASAVDLSTAETLLSDAPWLTLRWAPNPPRLVIEAAGAYAEIPAAALMPAAALLDVLAAGAALGPVDDSAPLTAFGLGYAAGAARELAHRCAGGSQ